MSEIGVYLVEISAPPGHPRELETMLSPEETGRAAAFRFERDRLRYLAMHGALRRILSLYLGIAAEKIVFGENEYGKPFVRGGPEFNISYSGDRGLIAVAGVPVGVDVEMVDRDKVTPEMIEQVFSAKERNSHFQAALPDPILTFYRGWVRKESIVKAIGKGVSYPLELVDSGLGKPEYHGVIDGMELCTRDLEGCGADCVAALTAAGGGPMPAIRLLSASETPR